MSKYKVGRPSVQGRNQSVRMLLKSVPAYAAASSVRVVRSAAVNSSFEKFSGNSGSG